MKRVEGFRLRMVMGQPTVIGEGIGQINFNKLITFNTTAAYLWESVEGKVFSVDDLAGLLTDRFGIDRAIAQGDATTIARQWIRYGIVQE